MASSDDSFTECEETFGDSSYTFLEAVPDYLMCIICYGVLKDAVATDCCEKMFCSEHSSLTQTCPVCRHAPLTVVRNKDIDGIVKDLKVFCLHRKKGRRNYIDSACALIDELIPNLASTICCSLHVEY